MTAAVPNKKETLDAIIEEIFKLDSPKIDISRKQQVSEFIVGAVNGDAPIAYLVLSVNLGENKKGIIAYILTNLRLIKIDIGINQNEIESNIFPLNTIIGIERKVLDNDRTQFGVSFKNGSIGLRYSLEDTKITDFFQKIDQPRESNV